MLRCFRPRPESSQDDPPAIPRLAIENFLRRCEGVQLIGIIAQNYASTHHDGLCQPIAANYVAC